MKELSEAFIEAFYCDSFADLFGEPTDGKVCLPSTFARSLLQDYETTTAGIMKDCISGHIDLESRALQAHFEILHSNH
jgi:hypothetical protein